LPHSSTMGDMSALPPTALRSSVSPSPTPIGSPSMGPAGAPQAAASARMWVQISGVNDSPACEEALELLGRIYRIHPVTLADLLESRALDSSSREKLEVFNHYVVLELHTVVHPTPTIFDIVHGVQTDVDENEREDDGRGNTVLRGNSTRYINADHFGIDMASASASAAAGRSSPAKAVPSMVRSANVHTGVFHAARVRTTPLHVVVFPHLVLSFHHGAKQSELNRVGRKLHELSETRMEGGQWIVHAILDSIVSSLRPIVAAADQEVDMLEELVFAPPVEETASRSEDGTQLLHRLALTRRRLLMLQQQLKSKQGIIQSLLQRASDSAPQSSGSGTAASLASAPYLRDLGDHVHAMLTTSDGAATMLESLQDAYLSQLQLRAESSSRALNDRMGKLSAFATILMPMSLISGIMGMNVEVPAQVWERADDGPSINTMTAFWTIILVMIIIGVTMTCAMRKRGYI